MSQISDCRRCLALFCDSLTFLLQCGQGLSCLGGAVIKRQTRDRKVASSTPGRGAIK